MNTYKDEQKVAHYDGRDVDKFAKRLMEQNSEFRNLVDSRAKQTGPTVSKITFYPDLTELILGKNEKQC